MIIDHQVPISKYGHLFPLVYKFNALVPNKALNIYKNTSQELRGNSHACLLQNVLHTTNYTSYHCENLQ